MLTVEQKLTNRVIALYLKEKRDGDYLSLFPSFLYMSFEDETPSITAYFSEADKLAETVAILTERYGK